MQPVWYGLYERIARVNGLTSHGRRVLRREIRSGLRENLKKARAVTARYAGKPLTEEIREQLKGDLIAAFAPPTPIELNVTFANGEILHVSASGAIEAARLAGKEGV